MDNYEERPADSLLEDLFYLGKKTAWTPDDQIDYDIDVAAIKHAVIREASVGTVYVARDGTDGCPEFRFRCAESLTAVSSSNVCQLCRELIPERQYVLIPSNWAAKETP